MSIEARAGETIHPTLEGAPAGLVGTLTVAIRKLSDDTLAFDATTAGIIEQEPTDPDDTERNYTATVVLPDDLTTGEYQIEWNHPDLASALTEPLGVTAQLTFTPSIDDVAGELRARTVDADGDELAEWDDTTTPTAAQAVERILAATDDLARAIGPDVPDAFVGDARRAATLRAAALIERSFIPEQSGPDSAASTIYQTLRLDYEAAREALQRNVQLFAMADGGLV